MTISGDYPNPVTVNGYSCKNCTDVDYATKHIDPAHPKDGPYGIDAKSDPTHPKDGVNATSDAKASDSPAVKFGGQLVALTAALNTGATPTATQGLRLDISA